MKTLRILIVVVLLHLLAGCATCRPTSSAQAGRPTEEVSWWQSVVGFIFGFAANSAYSIGADQQRIQSSDPTR